MEESNLRNKSLTLDNFHLVSVLGKGNYLIFNFKGTYSKVLLVRKKDNDKLVYLIFRNSMKTVLYQGNLFKNVSNF